MNITRLTLDNRVTAAACLAVLLFAGFGAYRSMPRDEDPGFIIRFAQVMTRYPGAGPERMEQLISDKIEKVVQEMPELKSVTSENRTGLSIVLVELKAEYTELRPIWDKLRRKIDKIRGDLPQGVIGPTVNDEFGDVFGIVAALTGEGFSLVELKAIADEMRDEILRLPNAAKVEIRGAQDERIFVEYDNARLARMGLSPYALLDILAKRNIVRSGGYVDSGDERIAVEPSGNFETLDQVRRTVVALPGAKGLVYLGDIVSIKRGTLDPPDEQVRHNGRPALSLAISMREGGNMVALGKQVEPLLKRLEQMYPWGVELSIVNFQPEVVTTKINEFVTNLVQAIVIVMGVMLVFLGLRTGLVVASLIPTAIVAALLVMSIVGIGLDQMSLAALIIALGLLVDNAIVVAESTMGQMERGKKPVEAALSSAGELRVPLLVASLTTAAAFLPIYLAESQVGEYTAPLFTVVSITLFCSWLAALTLTPLLCVVFLKVKKKEQAADGTPTGALYRVYRASLVKMLRRPVLSLVVVVAVFVGVMSLARFVPALFFPNMVAPTFLGSLKLPAGTPIHRTEAVVKELESFISKELAVTKGREQGIESWITYIGNGGPRFRLAYNGVTADPSFAGLVFNATDADVVFGLRARLAAFCLDRFPDLQADFKDFAYGPPVNNPIEVRLSGREAERLFAEVERVKAKLRALPGTRNIDDNWGRQEKKLLVRVDQARARRAGVSNEDIAMSLQTAFSGLQATTYREENKVIPIVLRTHDADRLDLGKIEGLNVYSQRGGAGVSLKQVADVEMHWSPGRVLRKDRMRTVSVTSQLAPGVLATSVVEQLQPWLKQQEAGWGLSIKAELGGADQASAEANQSIADKLPVCGFFILLMLIAQFNNLRKPLIILTTIPLALIGVVLGLLIARSYFGFMTVLGVVSLSGIVINNAIVLLDRIRIEHRENGRPHAEAVVVASMVRLRPILLTTVTTVGGLLPLWLGGGPMWEPMAITIIFGLLFSTVLTLGFIPLFYSLLFRVKHG